MADRELLPCPFCGSQVTLLARRIECDICLCNMDGGVSQAELIVSWNCRASMTAVIEQPQQQPQSSVHQAVNDAGQGSQGTGSALSGAAPCAEGSAK